MSKENSTLMSRRTILKIGALASAALAVGLPSRMVKAAVESDTGKNPNQIGFRYNQQACIGCRSCEYACKVANNWEPGAKWRRVLSSEGISEKTFLSISCNHCDDPACVKVCPVHAYSKREKDGIVIHDPEKCVGCKYCLYACPYHAPQYSEETGRITKCHFCYFRQDQGEEPKCVSGCPTKALSFGPMLQLRKIQGGVAQLQGLPSPKMTNPSWVIIPKE